MKQKNKKKNNTKRLISCVISCLMLNGFSVFSENKPEIMKVKKKPRDDSAISTVDVALPLFLLAAFLSGLALAEKTENQTINAGNIKDTKEVLPLHYTPLEYDEEHRGIKNPGNSCFLNSALQFLFRIREVYEKFVANPNPPSEPSGKIGALHICLKSLSAPIKEPLDISEHLPILGYEGNQEDASETFERFCKQLGIETARFYVGENGGKLPDIISKEYIKFDFGRYFTFLDKDTKDQYRRADKTAQEEWESLVAFIFKKNYEHSEIMNAINKFVTGGKTNIDLLIEEVRRVDTDKRSEEQEKIEEKFRKAFDLGLLPEKKIDDPRTFYTELSFKRASEIKPRESEKFIPVNEAGSIIFCLTRFSQKDIGVSSTARKSRSPIEIPEEFSVNRSTLRLECAIVHTGCMNSGHYRVYSIDKSGDWWEYNDSIVTKRNFRSIEPDIGKNATALLYRAVPNNFW
ncbi:MAG: hypothetical protein LBK29_04130 [Oscillospiraceae bacterium]|nr:hypothetical protein [Oscillospiraceae bacterium]